MHELEFPILTFDEHRLSPALGYIFHRRWLDPYESIVSILWKFAKMNGLPGHVLTTQVAATQVDPYEGVEPSRSKVDLPRLGKMLNLPLKTLHIAVIPSSHAAISSPYFRYCKKCLSRGYHSVVHQLETAHLCPIHSHALWTDCRYCAYRAPYRLNAGLLDAPHRCSRCRRRYGGSAVDSIEHRRTLPTEARVAIGRMWYRHYS